MSWITNERIKRLVWLKKNLKQRLDVAEGMRRAAAQRADRLQGELADVRAELAGVQDSNRKALLTIDGLRAQLDGTTARPHMAVYPPYRKGDGNLAEAIADETRAKRYFDGQGDQ